MSTLTSFSQAIHQALHLAMKLDQRVISFGLGMDDPKGIFGTTLGLKEAFGADRVFDMPTSENAMTGIGIGCALNEVIPVMTHQRLDFFLLAMDQLVNNAAKWHYMFGGNNNVPITIRLIIGRGWGNGPTHTQNLQSWFLQVPGLKVVCPTFPADAKGLLLSSIFDPNPVVYIEHRWLHQQLGEVPEGDFRVPLGKAKVVKAGKDVTVVGQTYMTLEAMKVLDTMKAQGIDVELIDLRSVQPIDWETIFASVAKTSRLLVLDTSLASGSVGSEIISTVTQKCFSALSQAPRLLALPNYPVPTSPALTKGFYPDHLDIIAELDGMFKTFTDTSAIARNLSEHDVPGDWFKGPF